MKPYYEDNSCVIYHGDCREILPHLGPVDLVLTDPPYNAKNIGPNERVYENGIMQLPDHEYKRFCRQWFKLCRHISENIIFTPGIKNIWNYPQARWVLCWHKPCAISFTGLGGYNAWEPILVYGNNLKAKFGQDYIMQVPLKGFGSTSGIEAGHPCPKPLKVWKWILASAMKENQTVLDPMVGSGTTLRAAKDLGRKAIGIEIEEKYCEIAARRLQQEVLDLK